MAVIHRALFTWFLFMVFLVLLALRMDNRTEWNWFIVFLPMWFYDTILILYISIHMINDCRYAGMCGLNANNRIHGNYYRLKALFIRLWYMVAVILKITFMVLLCLKLEGTHLSWLFVFLPLLTLLIGLCINVVHFLILQWKDEDFVELR